MRRRALAGIGRGPERGGANGTARGARQVADSGDGRLGARFDAPL